MPKPETIARQQSKARILRIAQKGGDWKTVADALDVNYKTAWLWVSQERKNDLLEAPARPKLPWGGKRAEKIKREHLEFLEQLIADNFFLTLREMAEALHKQFGLKVVQQTIRKRIHCMMYSLRKTSSVDSSNSSSSSSGGSSDHAAEAAVTTEQQQHAYRAFAETLGTLEAAGKRVFYIDETNYNIWCAKKMERCRNMHVLACLSDAGIALWEPAAGALKADDARDFVRRALDAIAASAQQHAPSSLADVVLVFEPSASFATARELCADTTYAGVTMLQLPALASRLNPCERVFASFRAAAKQYLCDHSTALTATPEGKTVIEHRSTFLLAAAQEHFPRTATPAECAKSVADARAYARELLLTPVPVAASNTVEDKLRSESRQEV